MYKDKYLKYKNKYINLLNNINKMNGGSLREKPVNYPRFIKGDKVINVDLNKTGTINNLRDDSYEKASRVKDPTHYYYDVDYDDGSFNTYVSQNALKHLPSSLSPTTKINPVSKTTKNKFNVGDIVKRIGSSYYEGASPEAMGMIGTVVSISESTEWPPNSGRIIPKLYFINFPELYKGTKHENVKLGVVGEDLELVHVQHINKKGHISEEIKYILPKLGPDCWEKILNVKEGEELEIVSKYNIDIDKTYQSVEQKGSVKSFTKIFSSLNYPNFMFMEVREYGLDGLNVSIFYRDFGDLNVSDIFPTPPSGTPARKVFNDGLKGECKKNKKYNFKFLKNSPTYNLSPNISPVSPINNYLIMPNSTHVFANDFRPKSSNHPDGFIPDYSNKTFVQENEDSIDIDWEDFDNEINKDTTEESSIEKPIRISKKKTSKKTKKKSKKKTSKKAKKKTSKKAKKKTSKKAKKKTSKKAKKKTSKKAKKK